MGCSENACHRKRPEHYNHIWSYDFLSERLENGCLLKLLVVIDEFTRECLAIDVNRKIKGPGVVEVLRYLFAVRGAPDFIRSDNGPEFISEVVKKFLKNSSVDTLYIESGSPWENGYVESFNGKLRDELLNGEIFYTLTEARVLVERWRNEYNTKRPHSSLGYRPPAPETVAAAPPLGGVSSLSSLEIATMALT